MTRPSPSPRPRAAGRDRCPDCLAEVLLAVSPSGDDLVLDVEPDPAGDHLVTPSRAGGPPQAAQLHPRQADGAVAAGERLHLAHRVGCPYAGRAARDRPSAQRAARGRR